MQSADQLPQPCTVTVASGGDGQAACRMARTMAVAAGLGGRGSEEVVLVVSELASNLVKHAHGGTITLTMLVEDGRRGIEIVSEDRGPGIPNPEQALVDGFSTAGGLGCGLGTVHRLMDEFDISPREGAGGGARIVCRRWARPARHGVGGSQLSFGVATRPRNWTAANGDAFVVKQWDGGALVGVIDGLGHGALAHQAAEVARYYVERHYEQPLVALFRGVGVECQKTRGVVMALARFDRGRGRFQFASIGNVEARVFESPEPTSFVVRRGVLGTRSTPTPVVTEHAWAPGSMLVLHSDGLLTRWRWSDFPDLADAPASIVAQQLLRALARESDDATVLVVRQDR